MQPEERTQPQANPVSPARLNPAPHNRRRAFRLLASLGAAAAGAAALTALRPEQAQASTASYMDSASPVLSGTNTGSSGVGVQGNANGGFAVVGTNGSNSNPAIQGVNSGVGPGMQGISGGGIGVQGTTSSGPGNNAAVVGTNTGGGPGVLGFCTGPNSVGVGGTTNNGIGFGGAAIAGGTGVAGSSATGNAIWGFVGTASPGLAGLFQGPVTVTGVLTVMGAKSAAVRDAGGTLRRLYSLESPESWFEDFGKGQLQNGTATVTLEPGFAGVSETNDYHVFLTPKGEPKGILYVTKQTPSSFTVTEAGGGTSNIGFSYRVAAKRKDIAGMRLEAVDEPPVPELPDFFKTPPTAPKLPELPTMPTPPAPRPGG